MDCRLTCNEQYVNKKGILMDASKSTSQVQSVCSF